MAGAPGHADRVTPFRSYCTGLLLPGDRKSIEPMAAKVAPGPTPRRVPASGAAHGVDCPKCRKLTAMIHEIEDGTRPMTDDNLLELLRA